MRRVSLKNYLVSTVAAVVSGGLVYFALTSPVFFIKDVKWNYTDKNHQEYFEMISKEIQKNVSRTLGQSIWLVSLKHLENRISEKPWVREATIYRRFPNTLEVEIKPKEIIAISLDNKGNLLPIADDASILEPVTPTEAPLAPVVTNRKFLSDQNLRVKVSNILKAIPAKEKFLSRKEIASVHVDKKGEVFMKLKSSDTHVYISDENVDDKVIRVNQVLNYIQQKDIQGRVIDANFSKKVLVRLRNDR